MIINPILYQAGAKIPVLENPGSAADLLAGKQLVDQYGNPLTGTMPQRSAGDLTASGAEIVVPAGYYPTQVSKSVATAAHPKPTLSRSGGTVTATHVQSAGYTPGGTTTETLSITTQAGKTVTPTTYQQTAVASGRLTTGAVYVAGDANLVASNIKSGVSIFGVTGNVASVEMVTLEIGNAGSYDARFLFIDANFNLVNVTLPAGSGHTTYSVPNKIFCMLVTKNGGRSYRNANAVESYTLSDYSGTTYIQLYQIDKKYEFSAIVESE